MKYKLILDENNYLVGFVHTETSEDTFELNPNYMDLNHLNCYKLLDDNTLYFDQEKADETEKEKEEELEHFQKMNEQTYRFAEMCLANGVNADDFLDRIDAQLLYTSLMTDTLLEEDIIDESEEVTDELSENEEVTE